METIAARDTLEIGAPAKGSMYLFDGPRFNLAILARGKTPMEFAEEAGVHFSTVYRVCRGKPCHVRIALKMLQTLARLPANRAMEGGELSASHRVTETAFQPAAPRTTDAAA
jgi:hypothetical protein